MDHSLEHLAQYGYPALVAAVLLNQSGIFVPVIPVMLGMGALVGFGHYSPAAVVAVAWGAAMAGDIGWYELGRHKGKAVLRLLCRFARDKDACVRKAEKSIGNHGPRMLLLAKFLPGLSLAAPPMVGIAKMPRLLFLLWDGAGALIWSVTLIGLGYAFRTQIRAVVTFAGDLGIWAIVIACGLAALYFFYLFQGRRRPEGPKPLS